MPVALTTAAFCFKPRFREKKKAEAGEGATDGNAEAAEESVRAGGRQKGSM